MAFRALSGRSSSCLPAALLRSSSASLSSSSPLSLFLATKATNPIMTSPPAAAAAPATAVGFHTTSMWQRAKRYEGPRNDRREAILLEREREKIKRQLKVDVDSEEGQEQIQLQIEKFKLKRKAIAERRDQRQALKPKKTVKQIERELRKQLRQQELDHAAKFPRDETEFVKAKLKQRMMALEQDSSQGRGGDGRSSSGGAEGKRDLWDV